MSANEIPIELTLPQGTLLEGIVTTLDVDGTPHIAPMGPIVDSDFRRILLRPFRTSKTYANLKRSSFGVLHVTDDVELIAQAAVGRIDPMPPLIPAQSFEGVILENCCRWFAFRVKSLDDSSERTAIVATVVDQGTIRDFFGFNRAKHAVVETAILATRLSLLSVEHVQSEVDRLAVIVNKTAGHQEQRAFAFLKNYIEEHYGRPTEASSAKARP
jgi:hypothetical protein